MKIAPHQKERLAFLREKLDKLHEALGAEASNDLGALGDRLDAWSAKVAVIGQVKAGKSTFMNAFLGHHNFLPSDINPWTSVVTNIRINIPTDPETGARFEFFGESDWDEIVSGGSKIRDLTEKLLPGFDTELLRKQSEEMRDRAQRRLGKHYSALLGAHHDYNFVTPDLLKRYVCAGPGSDEGLERESLGRYAALTKVANVFMRLPDFQVPTVITDTPGVNDPFLVRDEFTCRSLDQSDVFVMVLSAHQPLTDVDIALIRILAEQDEKDVLIFVNRIDELDDYNVEVSRVMDDVSRRLKDAIPDIPFKIVAGSAYMADLALRDDAEAEALRQAVDTEELSDYLQNRFGQVPATAAERLHLASGLDMMRAALSQIIDSGVGSRQLDQLRGDMRAEVNAIQFVAKREHDSLQMQVESINSEVAATAARELQDEIDATRAIQARIEASVGRAEAAVNDVLGQSSRDLEQVLLGQIEAFCERHKDTLEDTVLRSETNGWMDSAITINLTPLQVQIERQVKQSFSKARMTTDAALKECLGTCRRAIRDQFDDAIEDIGLDELPFDQFSSTLTMAKKMLNLGIVTDRGMAFWRKPTLNMEKTLKALRGIASEELRAPVEKILAAFHDAQNERASAGLARIRVMLKMIDVSLAERNARLAKDRDAFEEVAKDPVARRQMAHRLMCQMEVLEHRLLNLSALDGALLSTGATQTAA